MPLLLFHSVLSFGSFSSHNHHASLNAISSHVPSNKLAKLSILNLHHREGGEIFQIPDIKALDFARDFASSGAWGKHPILLRNAFLKEAQALKYHSDEAAAPWPTWEDVMDLASDDEAEARLITHVTSDENSWSLELGPIEDDDIPNRKSETKWTLVVNDVDRFHPCLSEWIGNVFNMIPQWRRDDGQISISNEGGGIGSHVDDYDVFLIQMSGTRKWDVGKRKISTREEIEGLIPSIDVRVLDFWDGEIEKELVESFILEPGDVLYVPPRFGHRGTALSDGCMTLSAGLRAPSAKELMTKMSDDIVDAIDGKFLDRYTDPVLLHKGALQASNALDDNIKHKGKQLIRDAINEMLNDEENFDAFFGKLVTESKRMRFDYPMRLDDLDDECIQDLGVWGNSESAINAVRNGEGVLYAAEGTSWAYSILPDARSDCGDTLCRLFVDGTMRQLTLNKNDTATLKLIRCMVDQRQVNTTFFEKIVSAQFVELLEILVSAGYLYGSNE
eukprot:scaffold10270_cov417-Chaetoceros_neogracile.AAC.6